MNQKKKKSGPPLIRHTLKKYSVRSARADSFRLQLWVTADRSHSRGVTERGRASARGKTTFRDSDISGNSAL